MRPPLIPLQPHGALPALFLAPPGGGHVVCYRALAGLMGPGQPVHGLQPRGIDDGQAPAGALEEIAALLRRHHPPPCSPRGRTCWAAGRSAGWWRGRWRASWARPAREVELLALFDTAALTPEGLRLEFGDPAEVM